MKTHGFLDQLMKTAQQSLGGGMESLTGSKDVKGAVGGPFGKGALVGGALGLLLGNRKARKMGGKVAVYGGLAALGVMAYKAYGEYQKQKGGSTGTVGASPASSPAALPPPDVESHSQAILKALIAAAKADGHVDDRERELIEGEFRRIDADPQTQQWLHAELQKPLDPAEIARAATTPALASEMYLASLLAADEQNFMERAYLDELARQLKIDDSLKAKLEQQLRDAEGEG
ncbi:MAG: tellurite resistance TerB family protein [Xanthomonadaceae bacterium]|nr:tellurite resistance TerB family protein [Xanthomonadaceae bacterium]